VAFQAGKLEARINGETASSVVELAERFPVHVLDPKLHQLIESGPSDRRRFVDGGVFHVEHSYLAHWRDYRRALGQRNAALKAGLYSQLKSWTEPLIEAGEAVDKLRREYIAGLSRQLAAISERLLDSPVGLVYAAGWRADASLAQALERSGERERQLCITQVGPHRADIELSFAGGAVKDIASRGQQKLIAAALVLAQVAEFERVSGRRGTMLIDDPAAELDDSALQRLLAEMERLQAQKVITGLRLEALGPTDDDAVFHVEQGKVNPVVY
jgi:DNA replication and repair protein RecF